MACALAAYTLAALFTFHTVPLGVVFTEAASVVSTRHAASEGTSVGLVRAICSKYFQEPGLPSAGWLTCNSGKCSNLSVVVSRTLDSERTCHIM